MTGKSRISAALAVLGLVVGATAAPDETAANVAPIPVQVLSLTDLHGYLSETENQTIAGPAGTLRVGGAGYLKALLDRLRARLPNSFLIGSGDQFSAGYTGAVAVSPGSRR